MIMCLGSEPSNKRKHHPSHTAPPCCFCFSGEEVGGSSLGGDDDEGISVGAVFKAVKGSMKIGYSKFHRCLEILDAMRLVDVRLMSGGRAGGRW